MKLKEVKYKTKGLTSPLHRNDQENERNAYKIYVGNIPPNVTVDIVEGYFNQFGKVENAFFFREFENCKNAFVEFKDSSTVERVLAAAHMLSGRKLTVGRAKSRNQNNKENVVHNYKLKQTELKQKRYRPY